MSTALASRDIQYALADLQREALKVIAASVGVVGFVWVYANVWSLHFRVGSPGLRSGGSFVGGAVLGLGALASYLLSVRHQSLATHLLISTVLAAVTIGSRSLEAPGVVYLYVVPVAFASVLLSSRTYPLAFTAAAALTVQSRIQCVGMQGSSTEVFLPVAVVSLAALACWLSSRNLHTALAWVWSAYERALRNESLARERQAELSRALKALDEATYRLERANHMLALARDQAEEARRLKQRFAQTISHELRTPLNLIVGYTELMAEMPEHYGIPLPAPYVQDLSVVYRNARHLQNLVNDVLDLARIEAAQVSIAPEHTEPAALVTEVLNTVRNLVESRGLVLCSDLEEGLPALWLDPVRIRQVLLNLLNNAVRFTERGSITVSARREADEVIFAVEDTGVGIAPEDLTRIFEDFHQAKGGTRRTHEGAGLGLAISKRFVELHGGRMWVESRVGIGSTFYFALPIGPVEPLLIPAAPSTEAGIAAAAQGSGQQPVMLIATPSPYAAALLSRYVRHCRAVAVADLEQARRAARAIAPQVVVVDSKCCGPDQPDPEALLKDWDLPQAPFVISPLPGEEELRRKLAVTGYLIKPVSRQDVLELMRRLGDSVNRVLIVDDDRDFVRLIARMLEDNPLRRYEVTRAYSGEEALTRMCQRRPDLVLLDLALPGLDGFGVLERMRSNPEWQEIPVVIISAQEELDQQNSLQRGFVMIGKAEGLRPSELVTVVQSLVDSAVRASPEPPRPAGAPRLRRASRETQKLPETAQGPSV